MSINVTKDLVKGKNRFGEGWIDPGVGKPFTGDYSKDEHKYSNWCSGCEYVGCFEGDPLFWCMRCGYPNESSWQQDHQNLYVSQSERENQATLGCLAILVVLGFIGWYAYLQAGWHGVAAAIAIGFILLAAMVG